MALTLNEEHQSTGNGLGYQMSSYLMMRSLCNRKGLNYAVGEDQLLALKNTFDGLVIDQIDPPGLDGEIREFFPEESFEDVLDKAEDGVCLHGYPVPSCMLDSTQYDEIKKHFKFRQEIYDACKSWKEETFGDSEVISMHFRRGDFEKESSGMFLIDDDYYINALREMPADIPVLIFTNDKSYILNNPNWYNSETSNRFTLVKDILNGNAVDSKLSSYIDHLVDLDGQQRFSYLNAIRYYKSMLYQRPSSCDGPCELHECHDVHPDPPFSDYYQSKMDNKIYNHSLDLCLMSMCDYHIMANSVYGLWGVHLSNSKRVVYPKYWSQGLDEDNPEALLCDNPESCRPGFRCNQDNRRWLDLGGRNQTAELAGAFVKDEWIGLENPDQMVRK